jgi:hypothetical protein
VHVQRARALHDPLHPYSLDRLDDDRRAREPRNSQTTLKRVL